MSERTGKRSWRISNPEAFHERTVVAEESNLLKWAGQFHTVTVRDRRLERAQPELIDMPNAPLQTKRTDVGVFRGIEEPSFQLSVRATSESLLVWKRICWNRSLTNVLASRVVTCRLEGEIWNDNGLTTLQQR